MPCRPDRPRPANADGGAPLIILLAVLLGLTVRVTPLQIPPINMNIAVALGLTLTSMPTKKAAMRPPPRPARQKLLAGRLLWRH